MQLDYGNFLMFLNIRMDTQRNWISETIRNMEIDNKQRQVIPPKDNGGSNLDKNTPIIVSTIIILEHFKAQLWMK